MALSGILSAISGRLRLFVVLALLAALLGGGVVAGVLGTPTVTGIDNRFGGVNESTTVIESDLHVSNPNPLGITLGSTTVDYEVRMNDIPMANGTKQGISIPSGNATVPFTTYMSNERLPAWWVSHVRGGERTTLVVNADVHSSLVGTSFGAPQVERTIETDIIGGFNSTETREVNANREPVVDDPVLYVNRTSGEWGSATEERTTVETRFVVYNPKSYPVTVSEIGYDVRMNDVAMGEGSTNRSYTIPPKSTTTIEATTTLRNEKLDEWWVSHLERNQVTRLSVQFYLTFDLSSVGGGSVRVPLDEMNQTIETDIFGTKPPTNGDGAANESSTGNGETTDSPTETEGTTATDTPTESPTTTAEPTTDEPTTTDDGLLRTAPRRRSETAPLVR